MAHKTVAVLLHGGGLSAWSLAPRARHLEKRFAVVTPVIAGHGERYGDTFRSIAASANELVATIRAACGGRAELVYGLSLGAQIVCEALAQSPGIAAHAVIESALVLPGKALAALVAPTYRLAFGLIKNRGFSKAQAKALCLPPEMFEDYYRDSCRMSRQSLVNIGKGNLAFSVPDGLGRTAAKTLIVYGGRELAAIKKSAALLHREIKGSRVHVAEGCEHGEAGLRHSESHAEVILDFCAAGA